MYFLAQIDLAEISQHLPPASLPDKGSLAFFFAGEDCEACAVVHVPSTAPLQQTAPPKDAPPAIEIGGDMLPQHSSPRTEKLFPYWPVEIAPLEVSGKAREQDVRAAVEKMFGRHFFDARAAYALLGEEPRPVWWHSAIYYSDCLMNAHHHAPTLMKLNQTSLAYALGELNRLGQDSKALDRHRKNVARLEAERDNLRATLPKFTAFVEEVSSWIEGKYLADRMQPEDAAKFDAIFERSRSEFLEFVRYRTPSNIDELHTKTLLALMTSDDRAYRAIPEPIRALLNESCRLPRQSWHQMFGAGVVIQGNAALENEGNHMLLQLVYDDMLGWRFGDLGAYQFWISPEDLVRRNWSSVRLTFEGH